jgi:regulator of PEP synthase PpsR (kinase-PPPase family)
MQHLVDELAVEPLEQPGLYRRLYDSYYKRVEAIEFTVAHDDGKRTTDLGLADIVLIGVSRVGKTPLSMYLAMQGWKVANVPYVPEIRLPNELLQVDRQRVVALIIEPQQLLMHRRWRESNLGISNSSYVDRKRVAEELRAARHEYGRHGFQILDITDKPIETSGDEVISMVSRHIDFQNE